MAFSFLDWKKSEVGWVALVLAVVVGVSGWQLVSGEMKTRDEQRKGDLNLVAKALISYYADYGIYPTGDALGRIVSCGGKGVNVCDWGGGPIVDDKNVVYLEKVPIDPLAGSGREYVYQASADRHSFKLFAALEYHKDPEFKGNLTTQCGNNVQCNWYAASF